MGHRSTLAAEFRSWRQLCSARAANDNQTRSTYFAEFRTVFAIVIALGAFHSTNLGSSLQQQSTVDKKYKPTNLGSYGVSHASKWRSSIKNRYFAGNLELLSILFSQRLIQFIPKFQLFFYSAGYKRPAYKL
jgi:hypothetical protein